MVGRESEEFFFEGIEGGVFSGGFSAVLGPFILLLDLGLLLRGEIIDDVEKFADFLGLFPLDHVSNALAPNIQERLDIEVVGSQDNLKEHLLIHADELVVPFTDLGSSFASVVWVFTRGLGVLLVVLAPLDDFLENAGGHIGQWDGIV